MERRLDLNLQMQEIKEAAGDDPLSSVTAEREAWRELGNRGMSFQSVWQTYGTRPRVKNSNPTHYTRVVMLLSRNHILFTNNVTASQQPHR